MNSNNHQLNDFDRFPSFNLQNNHGNHENIHSNSFHVQNFNNNGEKLQNYSDKAQSSSEKLQNGGETLTPEERRRREILAIKQELDLINKKM